jgi:hypothetical protein
MIFIFKHEIISTQSAAGAVECGVRWQHYTIAKVAEAFTGVAFAGVALDDWLKQRDGFVRRNADRRQAVEQCAVEAAAQIQGVFARHPANKGDFAEKRTGAAIWATDYTQTDGVTGQPVLLKNCFKLG